MKHILSKCRHNVHVYHTCKVQARCLTGSGTRFPGGLTEFKCILNAAPGEAYDKVARLLGLELRPSGGAAVEALAHEGDNQRFKFSMPLRQRPNCNFSYAGLKTAVRLAIEAEAHGPATDDNRQVAAPQNSCGCDSHSLVAGDGYRSKR